MECRIINLNMSSIQFVYCMGDIHGEFAKLKKKLKSLPNNSLLLICGDVGLGFKTRTETKKELKKLNIYCSNRNLHLGLMRGNHDNPKFFLDEKISVYSNIIILRDYDILSVKNKNILIVGGGVSIDRSVRIKGVSYWEDEEIKLPSLKQISNIKENQINMVLSHISPQSAPPFVFSKVIVDFYKNMDPTLEYSLKREREDMEELKRLLLSENKQIDYWVFGHYHRHLEANVDGINFIGLNIFETKEIWK